MCGLFRVFFRIFIAIMFLVFYILNYLYATPNTTLPNNTATTSLLDFTDIESMLTSHATSLMSKKFIQKLESKKIIAISTIENTTQEPIDIESIMISFKQQIAEKFIFTNAIGSNVGKVDKLIKDSRKLRNNAEYNQYTTKEEGGLLAPDYSLSGKISKSAKIAGKNSKIEYEILLRLTDLATGVEVWSNVAKTTKILPTNTPKAKMSNNEWEGAYEKCLGEEISSCQSLVDNGLVSVEQCDKQSCNKIGTILRNMGRLDEAMEYYKQAIKFGNYAGYRYLAMLYDSYKKDFTNAEKHYEVACNKYKDKESCGLLGGMYVRYENVPKEKTDKVVYYYKKACDLGSGLFCSFMGMIYDGGKGVKADSALAKHYYQKACELDSGFCKMIDLRENILLESKHEWDNCIKYKNPSVCKKIIDSGIFPSADKCDDKQTCNGIGIIYKLAGYPQQAIPYYERAASLGSNVAMFNLGLLYRQNNDKQKAKKYYQPACDNGAYEACYGLGHLLVEERDFFNARKYFEILCDKSSSNFQGDSCGMLGLMYANGDGVRQDYNKAFEYHKKSCDLKSPEGCGNLGLSYYFGQGTKQDFALAKQYYGKACDLGSQKACENYKRLNNQGIK